MRRNAVFSIFTGLAILPVITVLSGFTIGSGSTVYAIPAVRTLCLDLVAVGIGQPCSVEHPVVDAIVQCDADYGCGSVLTVLAVFTVGSVLTVFAVGPVINRNG